MRGWWGGHMPASPSSSSQCQRLLATVMRLRWRACRNPAGTKRQLHTIVTGYGHPSCWYECTGNQGQAE